MNREIDVLLVEDNINDAEMIIRALKNNNLAHRLLHVRNGAEALDFLFNEGAYSTGTTENRPKVILLDLNMPLVDGMEVLTKIKADDKTKLIPVVMLTSSNEDPDIQQCYTLGANGYVVKPLEFEAFNKAVSNVGLYWMTINQKPA